MSYRAAIILLQDNQIALMNVTAQVSIISFPGGHVEPGRNTEQRPYARPGKNLAWM